MTRQYLLAFLPLNFLAVSVLAADHGRQRFVRYNLFRTLPPVVYLGGLTGLWLWESGSVAAVVWANWLGTLATVIIWLFLSSREIRAWPRLTEAICLLRSGGRFHLTALIIILSGQLDRLVVISLWDDISVGLYVVAMTVATSALSVVPQTFHTVMFPQIAATTSDEARRGIMAHGIGHAFILLVGASSLLIGLSPWLIPVLFGQPFQGAVAPAQVLLLAQVPLALRQIIIRSLRGVGEVRAGVVAEAICLAGFLVLCAPFARAMGLVGIGLALCAGHLAALAYLRSFLKTRFGIRSRDCWGSARPVREVLQATLRHSFSRK